MNPHDGGVRQAVHDAIRAWPDLFRGVVTGDPDDATGERVLDLSCGSGEVTDALLRAGVPSERVDACDPYTGEAFEKRHPGKKCFDWSFEDIARGDVADRKWRVIEPMNSAARLAITLCVVSALADGVRGETPTSAL